MQPDDPAERRPEPDVLGPPTLRPEPASRPPETPEASPPAASGWDTTPTPGSSGGGTSGRTKAIVLGAFALVAAAAVAIGAKVLPLIAAGALGSALAGAFGGPWDRMPADARAGFEQRLEAAVGERLEGVDDSQKTAQVESMVRSGMPRLSDDRLVRRLILQTTALKAADESVCADFGRQSLAGRVVGADTATALFEALPTEDVVDWVEIGVEAIEAEARGFPDPTYASEAEASALIESVLSAMPASQVQTMADVNQGTTATDADVCAAVRSLYDATNGMGPASQAVMARIDIQP